jgi:type IV pilus assembly protein PilQ
MLGSNRGRFHLAGGLLGGAFVLGILACAGSAARQEPSASPSAGIEDIVVESEGSTSRLTVLGPADPIFTAFQQSDPDRLIVDLAGVESAMDGAPIPVYDGRVEEISVAPFPTGSGETMTRVEIALAGPVDYDVRPGQGGLVIELTALEAMSEMTDFAGEGTQDRADAPAEQDPWAVTPDAEPFQPMEGGFEETREAPADAGAPGGVATTLRSVESEQAKGGVVIHLVSDGMLESAETFTLDDPARLVVDLAGMKSEVKPEKIEVGSPHVARIRVGAHADKVRVVMDGGSTAAPFEGRQVLPVSTGLLVALGSGPAVDAAVASASAAAPPAMAARDAGEPADVADDESELAPAADAADPAERAPGSGPVTIFGVEFDSQPEHDRVTVVGEHPVDYLVYEPDPETLVVSLEEAVLDPDAAVRLAPEPGGPISLVTAFAQPEVARPEVRVVVKRATGLQPQVSRHGALLVIDFPRGGPAAATPPVLGMPEQTLPTGGPAAATAATAPADGGLAALPAEALPESLAPTGSAAGVGVPADPAAIDPPAAIAILNEGGLMDGKEYVGRRISLDFKEVEIADVLRLVAEVSDLNVIAGDEVKGKVTIRLVDVPWDQALDVILLTKGLGFIRIGNVLRIAAADVIAQEEELRLQERRAKEKLEDLVVKLQPVNYADVKDISKMVKQLLTPRGSVNTDTRTNTLIIKDIASVIDEATALIKAVDTMTPQVMIEAKIVEASLDFSRELGSIWTFGANPLTQSTLGGRDWVFTDGSEGLGNNVGIGNTITSFPNGLANIAASVLDEKFNLEAQLQAAEINGDGKVISSPRVVTLDNSKAQIEQGVSIPFQTFENGDAQLEFVDAVLQLKTTPHITSDKSIIMEIEVSRNAPDDSVFTLTGSPAIAKNQVKTETLVKDGQTLVLGGIYVVDKSERESRVPYLHRVPFLGLFFKSHEFSDSRKELLIFVTPRIVQAEAVAS